LPARVSPTEPYHHFADKQALLDAVAAEGFDELRAAMERRMAKSKEPRACRSHIRLFGACGKRFFGLTSSR